MLRHLALTRLEFSMISKGGVDDVDASPFSFAFYCAAPDDQQTLGLDLPTCMMLTVPVDCPLADFSSRFRALVSMLRVRWANAGYSYSGWEEDFLQRRTHGGVCARSTTPGIRCS